MRGYCTVTVELSSEEINKDAQVTYLPYFFSSTV